MDGWMDAGGSGMIIAIKLEPSNPPLTPTPPPHPSPIHPNRYVAFDIPLSPNLSPSDFAHLPADKMRSYHVKGLQLQLEQFWQVGFAWAGLRERAPGGWVPCAAVSL